MSIAALAKRPVKAIFKEFPLLDILCRRFVWKAVYPRLYLHEAELHYLNGLPRKSIDVAIDVGAAMGTYAWILDKLARKVYAFEPGRVHSECLRRASFGPTSKWCGPRSAAPPGRSGSSRRGAIRTAVTWQA